MMMILGVSHWVYFCDYGGEYVTVRGSKGPTF